MKIAIAQMESIKGDIAKNITKHKQIIDLAVNQKADVIIFPELSLTGYEPSLASDLAIKETDNRLDIFQELADKHQLIIGLGAPTLCNAGICISLIIFQPNKSRSAYSKKYLHPDEEEFFVSGNSTSNLIGNNNNIALAICYEIFIPAHSKDSLTDEVDTYIASVAKHQKGVAAAEKTLSEIAKNNSVTVLMSNAVGLSDDFISFGNSAVWNKDGKQLIQFNNDDEGIITVNIKNQKNESNTAIHLGSTNDKHSNQES